MKNNKWLKILQIINSMITLGLIIGSFVSFFYIGRDIITYHIDLKSSIVLFRILISILVFIVSLLFLLTGMIFPDEPYFLNSEQQKGIKNVTKISTIMVWLNALLELASKKGNIGTLVKAGATTSILANASNVKFVRRVWNWWISLIVFLLVFLIAWFSLGISYSDKKLIKNDLISPFLDNFGSSVHNSLTVTLVVLLLLLTIFSMLWRVVADKVRRDDEFWVREPITSVFFGLFYFVLMVGVTMYFNLSYWKMFILVVGTMILASFIEFRVDPVTNGDKKRRIFNSYRAFDSDEQQGKGN